MLLYEVCSSVESNNNPSAIRFENVMFAVNPSWIHSLILDITKYNGFCNLITARAIACTSYGKYQMLGANIYDKGWVGSISLFWSQPAQQDTIYDRFISAHGFDMHEDLSAWSDERYIEYATFYNGPGNVADYVAAMKSRVNG